MSVRYNGKPFSKFYGEISLVCVNTNNGVCRFDFEDKRDWQVLVSVSRQMYKIKTRKKRIVKKYVNKLMNEVLRKMVEANSEI